MLQITQQHLVTGDMEVPVVHLRLGVIKARALPHKLVQQVRMASLVHPLLIILVLAVKLSLQGIRRQMLSPQQVCINLEDQLIHLPWQTQIN